MGVSPAATAVELNPKAIAIRQADELKWRDPTGAAPVNQVVLFGDPTKPGFYMVMNRFKPGTFSRPHFHPNDRFITVIKGTWYVGTGNKWDKDATIPVKAGGAVTHFGKEVHYDGAKDEEVIVLITGEGPAPTRRSKSRNDPALSWHCSQRWRCARAPPMPLQATNVTALPRMSRGSSAARPAASRFRRAAAANCAAPAGAS